MALNHEDKLSMRSDAHTRDTPAGTESLASDSACGQNYATFSSTVKTLFLQIYAQKWDDRRKSLRVQKIHDLAHCVWA